ncbi:hypothetical protein Asp14428_04450 [Actinoplanes sp. NBRC 14428]|nr:hypothetical protein Asp14428_04450 [Actinoplanes sp. NBRC 14428]
MMLLLPADPLRPRRPDEHFAPEAAAARDAGVPVAVIDHDAFAQGRATPAAVALVPAGEESNAGGSGNADASGDAGASGDAVYRGWMLRSEHYADLATALAARHVTLRTSADAYRRAHELPGWYDTLRPLTPETAWTEGDAREDFERALTRLGDGPAVLRDYTKSMKHYWHEAAYIPDVADRDRAWRVASRFRELRGDEYAGGFVLRRFEPFTGAEARTWWAGGECRLVTAHPDTPDELPPDDLDLSAVAGRIAALGLPFVTADLVRRDDGDWRVVEVGDGQVSDRPASTPAEELIAALSQAR